MPLRSIPETAEPPLVGGSDVLAVVSRSSPASGQEGRCNRLLRVVQLPRPSAWA